MFHSLFTLDDIVLRHLFRRKYLTRHWVNIGLNARHGIQANCYSPIKWKILHGLSLCNTATI